MKTSPFLFAPACELITFRFPGARVLRLPWTKPVQDEAAAIVQSAKVTPPASWIGAVYWHVAALVHLAQVVEIPRVWCLLPIPASARLSFTK